MIKQDESVEDINEHRWWSCRWHAKETKEREREWHTLGTRNTRTDYHEKEMYKNICTSTNQCNKEKITHMNFIEFHRLIIFQFTLQQHITFQRMFFFFFQILPNKSYKLNKRFQLMIKYRRSSNWSNVDIFHWPENKNMILSSRWMRRDLVFTRSLPRINQRRTRRIPMMRKSNGLRIFKMKKEIYRWFIFVVSRFLADVVSLTINIQSRFNKAENVRFRVQWLVSPLRNFRDEYTR